MSDLVTTATLRDRIKRDTGFEGDTFAADAGLTDDILRAARWLADELLSTGQEYVRASATLNTTPGLASYSLPADVYRVIAVHVTTTAGKLERAYPFEWAEYPDLANQVTASTSEFGRYRIGGTYGSLPTETIEWVPTPQFSRSFRVDYVPSPTFVLNAGEYNVRSYGPAFEEFIVADVCAKLIEREEGDPSPFYARRAQALERIRRAAPRRDRYPTRPTRTRDVYGFNRPRTPWDRRRGP